MTDYLQNGYRYMTAFVGPSNKYVWGFTADGGLQVVNLPFESTAKVVLDLPSGVMTADANSPVIKRSARHRVTTAELNLGHTLLAAVPGGKYRLWNLTAIAYGANAGTATAITVLGTQAGSSVILCSIATDTPNLDRSIVMKMGGTGCTVLADGASYAPCDVNTAITVISDGVLDTCTGIDFILTYSIES